jgi:hypothetical protein
VTLTPTGSSHSQCQIAFSFYPAYVAPNNKSRSKDLCPISYSEQLARCSTPKLEAHPPSAVRDWLFNILAAAIHNFSIHERRTRHAVPCRTGWHLPRAVFKIRGSVVLRYLSPYQPVRRHEMAWYLDCTVFSVWTFSRDSWCDRNDGVRRVTMRPNVLIQRDRKGFLLPQEEYCTVL